jgi:hypothetical protein
MGRFLMTGSPIRQDYLETAIKWIAEFQKINSKDPVRSYMAQHQHDQNASQLWQHFSAVITWVTSTFDVSKRKDIMKGVNWGKLYKDFGHLIPDKTAIDKEIGQLIIDSEVQNKKGICSYVLTRDEHDLGLRTFPDDIKLAVYERQHHHCQCTDKQHQIIYKVSKMSVASGVVDEHFHLKCRDRSAHKYDRYCQPPLLPHIEKRAHSKQQHQYSRAEQQEIIREVFLCQQPYLTL